MLASPTKSIVLRNNQVISRSILDNDASISRRHCTISVAEHRVTLEDSSKYGTYIEKQRITTQELLPGQTVTFGIYESTFTLQHKDVTLVASGLSAASKIQFEATSSELFIKTASQVTPGCILVLESQVVTQKLVTALAMQCTITSVAWLKKLETVGYVEPELPVGWEPAFKPNPKRATLFKGFIFCMLKEHDMDPIVRACGGVLKLVASLADIPDYCCILADSQAPSASVNYTQIDHIAKAVLNLDSSICPLVKRSDVPVQSKAQSFSHANNYEMLNRGESKQISGVIPSSRIGRSATSSKLRSLNNQQNQTIQIPESRGCGEPAEISDRKNHHGEMKQVSSEERVDIPVPAAVQDIPEDQSVYESPDRVHIIDDDEENSPVKGAMYSKLPRANLIQIDEYSVKCLPAKRKSFKKINSRSKVEIIKVVRYSM